MGNIINIDYFYQAEENPVIMAEYLEKYAYFKENVPPLFSDDIA
jgi:hypothetical protein